MSRKWHMFERRFWGSYYFDTYQHAAAANRSKQPSLWCGPKSLPKIEIKWVRGILYDIICRVCRVLEDCRYLDPWADFIENCRTWKKCTDESTEDRGSSMPWYCLQRKAPCKSRFRHSFLQRPHAVPQLVRCKPSAVLGSKICHQMVALEIPKFCPANK